MRVICPWPKRELSPNSRTHWGLKSRIGKTYRWECNVLAREAGLHKMTWPDGPIDVHVTFHPPDKRKRDDDNMEGSIKFARDGIAEAMGVDDNRFVVTREVSFPIKGGRVVVSVPDTRPYPKGAG